MGASEIYGQLTATGNVWLLNPQGVYFGADAHVDVAGILASTYDMSPDDFMAGN